MNDRLRALRDSGVSIWLDDLSRDRIASGNLSQLINSCEVVGVTTNPAIFASALASGASYDAAIAPYAARGASVDETVFGLTTSDVRDACDILKPVWETTRGVDGRVSIEVSPDLAHDTQGTVAQAHQLWTAVARPNVMIKIPATDAGLPAITEALGAGISVNVTLIFGLPRYRQVMAAYLAGLELAQRNGHDLRSIDSVASFFVSRLDTEIDARLNELGGPTALALRGKAGVANAQLALAEFDRFFDDERWQALLSAGAQQQRPLWASTGVKNPEYDDTMYVAQLVASGCVNTMPEKTLQAFADHGEVTDTIREHYHEAQDLMAQLAAVGISYDQVIETLEREGVEKFVTSWRELQATVQTRLEAAK